jgi:hypothetical protein
LFESLLKALIIRAAIRTSTKLRGTAKYNIPKGSTLMFPTTSHMSINPTNQAKRTVCQKENLRRIIKTAIAKQSDQIPQTAPFIGSEGNIRPILS